MDSGNNEQETEQYPESETSSPKSETEHRKHYIRKWTTGNWIQDTRYCTSGTGV